MIDHRPDNPSVDDLVAIAVQTLVHEVENEMVKVTPAQSNAADQPQSDLPQLATLMNCNSSRNCAHGREP